MSAETKKLAKRLNKEQAGRTLTRKNFVTLCGVPGTVMHRIMCDKVDPRLSTLEAIAKGLGITASELLK